MEQHRGLGEERSAQAVFARRELESAPAEIGAGPRVGRRERLARAQEDRDRLLVTGLRTRGNLCGYLDGRRARPQQNIGGLTGERPPRRNGDALTDGISGDVVPEGKGVTAFDPP